MNVKFSVVCVIVECINQCIDTFNYDADYGELDIHLKPNTIVSTVLEEYPEEEVEETNKEVEE